MLFSLTITTRYLLLGIFGVTLIEIGSPFIGNKYVISIYLTTGYKYSIFPYLNLVLFGKSISFGKDIDYEPDWNDPVPEDTNYKDIYSRNINGIYCEFVKSKQRRINRNTEEVRDIWLITDNTKSKYLIDRVKYVPMYNRNNEFQYPYELVKIILDIHQRKNVGDI